MLFDWIYSVHRGDGKVQVWDIGLRDRDGIPPETRGVFGKFLFPHGDEPGRDPESFYTADFLADRGFRTVTCPASSSYGDNVFSPRNWYHMANTFDSFQKGMADHLEGSLLTSWTVHLFPYELQLACIAIPAYLAENPEGTLEGFQREFVKDRSAWTTRRNSSAPAGCSRRVACSRTPRRSTPARARCPRHSTRRRNWCRREMTRSAPSRN